MAAPGQQQEPTQEELEAFFAQLREIPAGELVMQAMSTLAAGAQAKLGQKDARVLIDAMEGLLNTAGSSLGPAAQQIADTLGQLKLAQVQLEKQMAASGGEAREDGEDGGEGQAAAAQPPTQPGPAAQPSAGEQKITDRLWLPGQ